VERVALDNLLGFFLGIGFIDDQRATVVDERTGSRQLAIRFERREVLAVRRANFCDLVLVGVTEDDCKLHNNSLKPVGQPTADRFTCAVCRAYSRPLA